jgi:hypothetical protein
LKKFQTDGGLEANGISTGQNADSSLPVLPKSGQQKGRDDLNRPGLATVLAGNKKEPHRLCDGVLIKVCSLPAYPFYIFNVDCSLVVI